MTDRELFTQALEALEEINKLSVGENAICLPAEIDGAMDALRERLAQPQQAHEINADKDAIGMAIQDTFVCGTGVVKLWFDGGKMTFDHVPINDFNVFGDELKWRAAHTRKEKKQ